MKKSTLITTLPTLGRVLTPVAMLVTLTREIVESQAEGAGLGWLIAIHIGALATVIGIESVGILAGHTFEGYWRIGDKPRAAIAFTLLAIYTAVGIAILWHNPAMLPIPIIASVVYLVSGLAESLDAEQTQQARTNARQSTFELEEEKKDRELERQLKLKKADAAAAAKLARIEARARQVSPETKAKAQPKPAQLDELSGKALEIYHALTGNPAATNTEIGEIVGVSRQYVGQVRRELNGSVNGVSQ